MGRPSLPHKLLNTAMMMYGQKKKVFDRIQIICKYCLPILILICARTFVMARHIQPVDDQFADLELEDV